MNVIPIRIPSLRERREDIPLLATNFLAKYSQENRRPIRGIAPEAMELLLRYHWPGNVRELENAVERAVTLGTGSVLTPESLPETVRARPEASDSEGQRVEGTMPSAVSEFTPSSEKLDLDRVVSKVERDLILEALRQAGGVQKKAAQLVGLSFESFRYRMKKYGIDPGGRTADYRHQTSDPTEE